MKRILTFTKTIPKIKFEPVLKTKFLEKRNFSIQSPASKNKVLPQFGIIVPRETLLCPCPKLDPKFREFGTNLGLIENFRLQKEKVETKDSKILCTVSSGQDSIITFFILLHSKKKQCLEVFYCQHFWQTKNFFSARLIFQISYLVKVPYTISLPQNFFVTENDSRDWRKKNFYRFSKMEKILATITGHTETDYLEKNLNNLMRGTSPAGLSKPFFFHSNKTVGLFFPTINQNTCLLTQKITKMYLKKNHIVSNLENWEEKKRTSSCNKKSFFCCNSILRTATGQVSFEKFKTKKTDQISLKKKRIYKQRPIFRNNFQFCKSLNTFSELKKPSKKRFGEVSKVQFASSQKIWVWGGDQNRFYFLNTKKSCSFLLSSELYKIKINCIKPLENLSRFSVSKLVKLYRFPLLIDITNFFSGFSRNKIRHQLFPFLRSLVHPNFEFLLTKFFKLLSEQNRELETDFQKVYFVSRLLKSKHLKLVRSFSKSSTSLLINKICKKTLNVLLQKLFFDYRNISLNYSQIVNLEKFY